ncbi:MAG: transglutaminase-like cysteine peptidase [Proteobacteria bacterium]|nr:transglutaminase-like cysteine peptidase [Pseudomonadota bacterium]
MAELAACRANPSGCGSKAAQRLLAIANAAAAKPGRARLGEVNRAVNLAIRPMSDMAQHGVIDFWNSPLATLTSGRGDCEDYAIVKYAALRLAGLAEHDLRLLIVRDKTSGGDHAVLAVRLEGRWLLLDNRGLMMIEDRHAPQYRALYAVTATAIAQLVPAAIAGSQLAALAARRAPAM